MHSDVPIWVRTREGVAFAEAATQAGGRMPDFCIIGSAKCGTTSLDLYLGNHPQVFVCPLKEPHYFSTAAIEARGENWYTGLYAKATPDQLCGEASTSYTRYPLVPGTAERMYDANPEMKLIYIVRNPVDRVESEALQTMKYLKNVMGKDYRHLSLDDFLAQIEDPTSPYFQAIVETSRYETQLQAFEKIFPNDQIMLLTQNGLRHDPHSTLRKIYDFLGLSGDIALQDSRKRNVTSDFFDGTERERVTGKFRGLPGYNSLKKLLPADLRSRLVGTMMRSSEQTVKSLSNKTRARLETVFAADNAALEARLGIPWAEW